MPLNSNFQTPVLKNEIDWWIAYWWKSNKNPKYNENIQTHTHNIPVSMSNLCRRDGWRLRLAQCAAFSWWSATNVSDSWQLNDECAYRPEHKTHTNHIHINYIYTHHRTDTTRRRYLAHIVQVAMRHHFLQRFLFTAVQQCMQSKTRLKQFQSTICLKQKKKKKIHCFVIISLQS